MLAAIEGAAAKVYDGEALRQLQQAVE